MNERARESMAPREVHPVLAIELLRRFDRFNRPREFKDSVRQDAGVFVLDPPGWKAAPDK